VALLLKLHDLLPAIDKSISNYDEGYREGGAFRDALIDPVVVISREVIPQRMKTWTFQIDEAETSLWVSVDFDVFEIRSVSRSS